MYDNFTLAWLLFYSLRFMRTVDYVDGDLALTKFYKCINEIDFQEFLDYLFETELITYYAYDCFLDDGGLPEKIDVNRFKNFIKSVEGYDDELIEDIFFYLMSQFLAFNKKYFDSNNDFRDLYCRLAFVFGEIQTQNKTIFSVRKYENYALGHRMIADKYSINPNQLPVFFANYKFCMECEDEDTRYERMSLGLLMTKSKKESLDELLSSIEAFCMDEEMERLLQDLRNELSLPLN